MEPPRGPTPNPAEVAAAILALDDSPSPRTSAVSPAAVEKPAPVPRAVDFILLSEFSELEGPVPLFRIPESAAPTFNVNDFVLRIMAVDHQASKAKEHACLIPDTQVVLAESDENIHAYIHHFSLLDIHARGYVRPYAMVYLSDSPVKLMAQFDQLLRQFSSVSAMLKESNSALFIRELERRVSDMRQTVDWITSNPTTHLAHEAEERLLAEAAATESAPTTLKDYLNDMEELLRRLKTHLLPQIPGEDSGSSVSATATAPSSLGGSATSVNSSIPIEDLQRASQLTPTSTASPALPAVTPSSSPPPIALGTPRTHAPGDITPPSAEARPELSAASVMSSPAAAKAVPKSQILEHLSSVQGVRNFEKRLRPLHELCAGTIAPVMAKFRAIQKHFSRSLLELKVDAEERKMTVHHLTSLLIGPRLLINFGDHVSRTLHPPADALMGSSKNLAMWQSGSTTSASASASASATAASNTPSAYNSASTSFASLPSVRVSMPDMQAAFADKSTTPPASFSPGTSPSSHNSVPAFFPSSAPASPMGLSKPVRRSTDASRVGDADNERDENVGRRVSDGEILLPGSPSAGPGKTILDLRSRYPFLKHILFSLLKGRTVVIMANPINESAVRHLTRALSFFVPRNCTRSVSPVLAWRRGPLKVMDLQFKLVGMSKGHSVSKAVEKHASILDYEQDVLKAPPYAKGDLIDDLINPRKNWPDVDAYLSWCYYRMMSLACKACLYYHHTCSQRTLQPQEATLGASVSTTSTALPAALNQSDPDIAALSLRRSASDPQLTAASNNKFSATASHSNVVSAAPVVPGLPVLLPGREPGRPRILRDWGVADSDLEILEHWVETVKEQQANFENVECAPIIRIDHSQTKVFRAQRGGVLGKGAM